MDPSNPWSFDNFGPPKLPSTTPPGVPEIPKVPGAPRAPRSPHPRNPVPRIDNLFDTQDNLIRALKSLKALDHNEDIRDDADYNKLRREVRQAYKVLNEYLQLYG